MTAQLRSELLKQRTTRTNLRLLGWMVGVITVAVALHVLSFSAEALGRDGNQMRILGLGTGIGALFAALAGALSITGEFRTGAIRPTLLITPRRTRVLAAKVAAALLAGLAVGLVAEALTAAVAAAGLAARGIDAEPAAGDYVRLLVGGSIGAAGFAAIGVGLGAAIRNQVAVVTGLCVWLLLLEPLLLGDVPSAARYAPEASAGALAGALQGQIAADLAAPAAGLALLVLYAGLAALAGGLLLARRDID